MTIKIHDYTEDIDLWRNPDHKSRMLFYCAVLNIEGVDEQTTIKRFVNAAKTKADELTGEDCHGGAWGWHIPEKKNVVVNIYKDSWSRGSELFQICGALFVGLLFYNKDIKASDVGDALIKEFPNHEMIQVIEYDVPSDVESYNLDVYYQPEKGRDNERS